MEGGLLLKEFLGNLPKSTFFQLFPFFYKKQEERMETKKLPVHKKSPV
jgi:hypothetical protein